MSAMNFGKKFTIASTSGPPKITSSPPSARPHKPGLDGLSATFNPKKVLVLTKITRYEFEKKKYPNLTDDELAELVRWRQPSEFLSWVLHPFSLPTSWQKKAPTSQS
jgi:hypothetical protein